MFDRNTSITEFLKKTSKGKKVLELKSFEEKELEQKLKNQDDEVEQMIKTKIKEMSFEVKPGWREFNNAECDTIQGMIETFTDNYRVLFKTRKMKDADVIFDKIKECKYAKMHLKVVMNLDFTKPTEKMRIL